MKQLKYSSSYLYLLIRLVTSYALLVMLSQRGSADFLQVYYFTVVAQVLVLFCDFGVFYQISQNGLKKLRRRASRNFSLSIFASVTGAVGLSFLEIFSLASLWPLALFVPAAYGLYIQKAIFVSRGRVDRSVLIEFLGQPLFLFAVVAFGSLGIAAGVVFICFLIFCRGLISDLYNCRPVWRFNRYEGEMQMSNSLSIPGSYFDVIAVGFMNGNKEEYILLREAIFKVPSLIQPAYLSIALPLLSRSPDLRRKFYIFNLAVFNFMLLCLLVFILCTSKLPAFMVEMDLSVAILTCLVMILRGYGSGLGVIFMVALDSRSSLIKNFTFVVINLLVCVYSTQLSFSILEWLLCLFYSLTVVLFMDLYLLKRQNCGGFSSLVFCLMSSVIVVYLTWYLYVVRLPL